MIKNSGRPWPSWVLIHWNHSGPLPALKFATVVGSSSSEDAKIGGTPPEVLSWGGRGEDCPSNILLRTWRFGYGIKSRRGARPTNTRKATTATAMTMTT